MLKTMLWQGVVAALVIGGGAAGYAQVRGNGYLTPPAGEAREAKSEHGTPKAREAERTRDAGHQPSRDRRHHD